MYGNHSSTFTLHFKELKLPEITGIKTTWLFVKTTDLLVDGMDTHTHPVYNYLFTDTERFFPLTKKLFHFLFLFTRTICRPQALGNSRIWYVCGHHVLSGTETRPGMMCTDDISRPNNPQEQMSQMNPCLVLGSLMIYGFSYISTRYLTYLSASNVIFSQLNKTSQKSRKLCAQKPVL